MAMDKEEVHTPSKKQIRKEMEDAEKKYQGYIIRRNEFNDKAREMREGRDLLHNKRKEIMIEVNTLRDERSKALDELRKHKERRDTLHQMARKIIDIKRSKRDMTKGQSISSELSDLRTKLNKLEYMQQTTPLTMDKERDVIDEIRDGYSALKDLEEEYGQIKEINDEVKTMDGELDTIFKDADGEHQLVVKYYEASRKYQKKMDEIYKEVSHLIAEADRKHTSFLGFRKKADEFHEKAMDMRGHLNEVRKENRERIMEGRRLIKDQNKTARQAIGDKEKLDEKYDEALEKLLKKEKIEL